MTARPTLEGELAAGTATYELQLPEEDAQRVAMTVTLPEGWSGTEGWVLLRGGGVEERTGVAITFWGPPEVVYRNPCRWAGTAIEVEPSAYFVAEALAAQEMRAASPPRPIDVGDHHGFELKLSVPDDIDISTCDPYLGTPYFQSWGSHGDARYHQGPGQRDFVRLVDVDGQLLIIDVMTWPELPADRREEVRAVLDSMTFDLLEGCLAATPLPRPCRMLQTRL